LYGKPLPLEIVSQHFQNIALVVDNENRLFYAHEDVLPDIKSAILALEGVGGNFRFR
jgi:hypothetical protein